MERNMTIEQRKARINQQLDSMGETVGSWSKKNKLDHRLVLDLIDGKLLGTRGVTLEARMKMEEFFGHVFDN
jgi:hypothetical protein